MINNLISNIKSKINTVKEENNNYNNLLKTSKKLENLNQIPNLSNNIIKSKINIILNDCPDLNKDKAILINKLIPINETYLTIMYSIELLTNKEYWIVPTNKHIWFINNTSYTIIQYNNINILTIIRNNLMSKSVNLNNILFEINGNTNKINNFISILTNETIRNNTIINKTKYLCETIPIYQNINTNNSGISIDNNNNIVFHTKENNYKYNKTEIINYEILIDNNTIYSKNQSQNNHITSFQNDCYTIKIKITTTNNSFIIPILEENALNTKYSSNSTIYIDSITFAKEIINKLNEI